MLLSVFAVVSYGTYVDAGFTTVIDSPPTVFNDYGTIQSNTQVNLYSGGVLPGRYNIGPVWQSGDNIEINLLGGTVGSEGEWGGLSTSHWVRTTNVTFNLFDGTVWGDVRASAGGLVNLTNATIKRGLSVTDGSLANITGGEIVEGLWAGNGSMIRMSGGTVGVGGWNYYGSGASGGSVFLMSGGTLVGGFGLSDSYANISGGRLDAEVHLGAQSLLEISGGTFGRFHVSEDSSVSLTGGEFQLDGVPVTTLGDNSQTISFPEKSVLTGVLADGTPIILANMGSLQDHFVDGKITLQKTSIPPSEPPHFVVPGDVVPAGLRSGQSLSLHTGGVAPANFSALPGSSVVVDGGVIGDGFEAAGASVTLIDGGIGELSTIYRGTTMQVLGGTVGSNLEAAPGSRLEVSGGHIGHIFVAHPESEVIYSGGTFGHWVSAQEGSSFTIAGGEFKINGVPIAALSAPGSERQIDLPDYGVLSGTLENGTPFAFASGEHWFAPGTLTLQAATVPAAGPMVIRLPSDPVPLGLRPGQTLLISDGGELGDYFTTDWGSTVRMTGGRIDQNFKAVGSFVNISGGNVESLQALMGSIVNISGGTVEYHVTARRGSVVNITGGEIVGGLNANDGGRVNVAGGNVGGYVYVTNQSSLRVSGGNFRHSISLSENSLLTLEGGVFRDELHVNDTSEIQIRGGRLGDGLYVSEQGRALVYGSDFRINGVPLGTDDLLGWQQNVDLAPGAVMSGVLADGTPFAFTSSEEERFSPGTLRVSSSEYFWLPRPISFPLFSDELPKGVLPGEALTLESGDDVGDNFTAGWDSRLTINGGKIGENFEAVGATVDLIDGSIGNDMDVLYGSELNILGGTTGYGLQVHQGGTANIAGGIVPEITVRSDSVVNITGGLLRRYWDSEEYSEEYGTGVIYLEAGSHLNITGTDFLFDYESIEGLEAGGSITLELDWTDLDYRYLSGQLADGSPLDTTLKAYPGSIPRDWELSGVRYITLTSALANLQVPEPTALALSMSMAVTCLGRTSRRRCSG
jgi:hypothetical protein